MNRRQFLHCGAGLSGGLLVRGFSGALSVAPTGKTGRDRVRLGPMQVELSRLAVGTGTNGVGGSSNQTRKLGLRGLADLLARPMIRASPSGTPPTSTARIRT